MRRVRRPATLVVVLAWAAAALLVTPFASTAQADSSARTFSGSGPFAALKVTVAKTDNLTNEVVRVSWAGGERTQGQGNFLQIMQCWGDAAEGPTREQCQFGGFENQLGGWASTRQVYYGDSPSDTNETYLPPQGSTRPVWVPFHPVNGETDVAPGNTNQFFDANTTNEVARGITYADGTGEAYFQMQTSREAPGLGCGARIDDATTDAVEATVHKCWLVVVPRGNLELPGITSTTSGGVTTSPLTVTNWAQRIVVPLSFQSIGNACPLGRAEVPIYGSQLAGDAVSSWQPVLCRTTSSVFGFSQVPDELARTALTSGVGGSDPGMAIVGKSVPAERLGSQKLVYAPLTISAIGIGFLIERSSIFGADDTVRAEDGQRLSSIKLTPRLVAKLLTQSYLSASAPDNPTILQKISIKGSTQTVARPMIATGLFTDPEFLALNPSLVELSATISDAIVPYIPADAIEMLWTWVNADPAARAFLDGKPDYDSPWLNDCGQSATPVRCTTPPDCTLFSDPRGNEGCPTYVNPAYEGLSLPQASFPKQDTYCWERPEFPALCALDLFPFANVFADGANQVARGDSGARSTFNGVSYSKNPVQFPGSRNLMAVTDTPSADRYALTMASLLNAAGEYVAPDAESMADAVAAMTADANGVLVPDPTAKVSGAYPLTTVSYAALDRATLTDATRAAFADFLVYAATDGQVVGDEKGQLPAGYLPLPSSLRRQTITAASLVAAPLPAPAPSTPAPTPSPTVSSTPTVSATPSPTPVVPDPSSAPIGSDAPVVAPTSAPTPSASPETTTSATPQVSPSPATTQVALTQPLSAGLPGLGAVAALALGAMAAVGAVVALRLASGGRS